MALEHVPNLHVGASIVLASSRCRGWTSCRVKNLHRLQSVPKVRTYTKPRSFPFASGYTSTLGLSSAPATQLAG